MFINRIIIVSQKSYGILLTNTTIIILNFIFNKLFIYFNYYSINNNIVLKLY